KERKVVKSELCQNIPGETSCDTGLGDESRRTPLFYISETTLDPIRRAETEPPPRAGEDYGLITHM
ncbi:hypothetical protein JMJ77_0014744, partial [Colletotrichum scovillei]